jgi:hypothetical protein
MTPPPAEPRPAEDSYEASYMKGAGQLIRREKTIWRLHWLMLLPLPLCWATAAMILAGVGTRPAPPVMALLPLFSSLLMLFGWVLFRVLRVHVTDREVHIQYGIFGPRIPASAIESCRVIPYEMTRYGGWGIRRGIDGSWAYTLAGDSSQVVEISWREGDKVSKVVVSSRDPEQLAASIQQARATAAPRLRAPADRADAAPSDAQTDADDEALLHAAPSPDKPRVMRR